MYFYGTPITTPTFSNLIEKMALKAVQLRGVHNLDDRIREV